MPFLTDIDPRARIRGSRDALGLVPLWGQFGRHVVGNLTTVSTSLRGFTTLLLGYHFARQVQERERLGPETTLPLFIKFEQLAAYCRWHAREDGDFRGVDRVKRRLVGKDDIVLSAEPRDQILASQKVYGLWGLYSNPARASGLVEQQETVLTTAAREIVEGLYLPALSKGAGRDGAAIIDLLRGRSSRLQLDGRHATVAATLANLFASRCGARERPFYWSHLAEGGPGDRTEGRQRLLAELMVPLVPLGAGFDRSQLRELIKQAGRGQAKGTELSERLIRIDRLESVLIPAASAFGFLQSRHGATLSAVATEIRSAWRGAFQKLDTEGFRALEDEISGAFSDPATGKRWIAIAEALATANFERLLNLLIEQNAFMMRTRHSGDPWIRVVDAKLDVRFRDESAGLVLREKLANAWRSNYFLDSLKAMVTTLRPD